MITARSGAVEEVVCSRCVAATVLIDGESIVQKLRRSAQCRSTKASY
jgi:hypothetical protein